MKANSRLFLGISVILVVFVFLFTLPYFGTTSENNNPEDVLISDEESNKFQSVAGTDCIPDINAYEIAVLVEVIDGDSIRVDIDGEVIEVRYIGIDAPEFYSEERASAIDSAQKNRALIGSGPLYLFRDISNTDKYDRLLRYVVSSEQFINLEMVRSGYATAKKYQPDISCQAEFEKAASSSK